MRSLRPTMIYPSYKATEYQSDMMRMKKNDDSLGRDTTLCGDPSFLSLMKGTHFFNEYNMDVEVTSSIFPHPSAFCFSALSPQPSSFSLLPSALSPHPSAFCFSALSPHPSAFSLLPSYRGGEVSTALIIKTRFKKGSPFLLLSFEIFHLPSSFFHHPSSFFHLTSIYI